ncbi:MAG TPA: hypothetical protein VKE95_06275 [Burkholderiales bacterium]|nr:hypothetical protein [Burkholderiales bacterium]
MDLSKGEDRKGMETGATGWPRGFAPLIRRLGAVILVVGFVLWAHFGSGTAKFHSQVKSAPGWDRFRDVYGLDSFGEDSYFVRAARNGYNLFYFTHRYGWRFTRKTARDAANSCAACHTPEDLAYAFVNSDRFDSKLGRRLSFEDSVMRCYAEHMDGFVPTLYDPAIRDLRILARGVAQHLQLGEGARRGGS